MPIRRRRVPYNGRPHRKSGFDLVKPLPMGRWNHGTDKVIIYWHLGEPNVISIKNYTGGKSYGYISEGHFVLHRSNGPAFAVGKNNGFNKQPEWYRHGIELEKDDFDSIEMVNQMKAWALFTPHEIAKLKNAKKRNKTKNH